MYIVVNYLLTTLYSKNVWNYYDCYDQKLMSGQTVAMLCFAEVVMFKDRLR